MGERGRKDIEILALRHQIAGVAAAQPRSGQGVRFAPEDRAFLAALAEHLGALAAMLSQLRLLVLRLARGRELRLGCIDGSTGELAMLGSFNVAASTVWEILKRMLAIEPVPQRGVEHVGAIPPYSG